MKRITLLFGFLFLIPLFNTPALAAELQYQDALIIDVRTVEEWQAGHLHDAILIPWDQIAEQIQQQNVAKDKQILLYCRSGNRAGRAQKILQQLGYTQVLNLGGVTDAAATLHQEIVK